MTDFAGLNQTAAGVEQSLRDNVSTIKSEQREMYILDIILHAPVPWDRTRCFEFEKTYQDPPSWMNEGSIQRLADLGVSGSEIWTRIWRVLTDKGFLWFNWEAVRNEVLARRNELHARIETRQRIQERAWAMIRITLNLDWLSPALDCPTV